MLHKREIITIGDLFDVINYVKRLERVIPGFD